MTFREKLAKEHPECVDERHTGGCHNCPRTYGYEILHDSDDCPEGGDCTKCWDREIPTEKTYEEGLQDAWELAKKIDLFDTEERTKIFGYITSEYIKEHYTVQEALAKLKAYEEEKEIKVGDVVISSWGGGCCYVYFQR